ncbi:MAG: hypothetical protein GY953_22780, partial [bacterium]|nr:hypothetical protein [bacterium]
SYSTLRGARKRDWPQSFSDASAWWPYYRIHGDHIGRASLALTNGKARNRVLVLTPTTSAFLHARRVGAIPEFEAIQKDTGAVVQALADHQVDFDIGDEYLLDWFGEVRGKQLAVGQQTYDLVIWPRHMENIRRQSAELLDRFLANGGEVLALSGPAPYVDGRPRNELYAHKSWIRVASEAELSDAVGKRLAARVRFDRELQRGVGFHERFLDDGSRMLFFNNAGPNPVEAVASVEGRSLEVWD